jgi:2-oxoglutarate ferredoxin oxidoreductase subunit gamma
METVPHVTFFPSYGAEVRGGSSHCQVILSPEEIPSPVADTFETMLLMNHESVMRFLPCLAKSGLVLINSSLVPVTPGRGRVFVPATRIADDIGDQRVANLVMLGALLKHKRLVATACIEDALHTIWAHHPAVLEHNLAAFRAGLALP